METLTLIDSHYTFTRTMLAATRRQPLGSGATALRRPYARVTYQFSVHDNQRGQADTEALCGFVRRHQGDTPFWWGGGAWGLPSTPLLVGEGDGVRTVFFCPNRWLLTTPVVSLNGVLAAPQPTPHLPTGRLTFAAPVTLGVVVTALYTCRYAVVWWFEGETLLTDAAISKGLFSIQGLTMRETLQEAA